MRLFFGGITVLAAASMCAAQQAHPFTLQQILSAPYALSLTAAPVGGQFAWIEHAEGARNIWVGGAKQPSRSITHYTEDDGQDINGLTWSPDATAIAYASYGNSVFIVEKMKDPTDQHEYLGVRQQFVQLGTTKGDLISITDGVKPGEEVVTAGVFKLRNGAPVQVNNAALPNANPTPKPANT